MENMTAAQTIEAMKNMTTDERIAFLKANRPDIFQAQPQTISFGKSPKDGWKESDRVAK